MDGNKRLKEFLETKLECWENINTPGVIKKRFRIHYLLSRLHLRQGWGHDGESIYHFYKARDELERLWKAGKYFSVLKFERRLDDLEFFVQEKVVA